MTIKKALEHFKWKFQNKWKPTESDLKALDCIIDFVNDKHQQQFNDNQLFAKLYITFYGELLKFYECTVFDKEPQKAINKILDTPIEYLIEKFIDKHQTIEYLLQVPKNDRYEQKKMKHPKDLNVELKEVEKMEYQETEDNFKSMINLALNAYN